MAESLIQENFSSNRVQNRFAFLLIVLMMVNYGARGYIFGFSAFIIYIFSRNGNIKLDRNSLLIACFSLSYLLFCTSGLVTISVVITIGFLQVMFYSMGRDMYRNNSPKAIIKMLIWCAIGSALIPIISVYNDIAQNGFIGDSRNMSLIGLPKDVLMGATYINAHIALMCSLVGLLFVKIANKFEAKVAIVSLLCFSISIVCVLRLGSRTGLVLLALSVLSMLVYSWRQYSKSRRLLILAIFVTIGFFASGFISANSDIMSFYMDRVDNDEFGVSTGGGRTSLMLYYLNNISNYPFGGIPSNPMAISKYAHNIFLDTARVSGIVPLFFILLITIRFIRALITVAQRNTIPFYLRSIFIIFSIMILSIFFVEPAIEGLPVLLILFFMIFGMLTTAKQ